MALGLRSHHLYLTIKNYRQAETLATFFHPCCLYTLLYSLDAFSIVYKVPGMEIFSENQVQYINLVHYPEPRKN
jgi:hypothetical protein